MIGNIGSVGLNKPCKTQNISFGKKVPIIPGKIAELTHRPDKPLRLSRHEVRLTPDYIGDSPFGLILGMLTGRPPQMQVTVKPYSNKPTQVTNLSLGLRGYNIDAAHLKGVVLRDGRTAELPLDEAHRTIMNVLKFKD